MGDILMLLKRPIHAMPGASGNIAGPTRSGESHKKSKQQATAAGGTKGDLAATE